MHSCRCSALLHMPQCWTKNSVGKGSGSKCNQPLLRRGVDWYNLQPERRWRPIRVQHAQRHIKLPCARTASPCHCSLYDARRSCYEQQKGCACMVRG